MNADLTHLLRDFPFEAGRVNARLVRGDDGRELLQIRVELGLLQMECSGRPDGSQSALEPLLSAGRALDGVQTAALRLELVQFQQRAVAFLAVGDATRALADAETALRGTELIVRHGLPLDRDWSESARFSVLVLRTRCAVAACTAAGRSRDAARAIEHGLAEMRDAAERVGIADGFDALGDVLALKALRDSLVPQLPPAQRAELEARLRAAILAENYELASILRDELRLL
jgi:hypothetical protein